MFTKLRNINWSLIVVPTVIIIFLGAAITAIIIASTSGAQEGTITDKRETRSTVCTSRPIVCVPTTNHWFELENEQGDTNTIRVSTDTYNQYEIGDYFPNN